MSDETTKDQAEPSPENAPEPTVEQSAVEEVFASADDIASAANDAAAADNSAGGDVAKLKSQVADAQRRVLLAQADLENYRKRARRDAEDGVKYAALPLIRDLLPCIDNLQRAIEAQLQAAEDGTNTAGMLEGVQMVSEQLMAILGQHHCKVIDASGEFDPNVHQAILQQPSPDHPSGNVIQVTQTGYQLHDRVIRPAQVIVSKGAE